MERSLVDLTEPQFGKRYGKKAIIMRRRRAVAPYDSPELAAARSLGVPVRRPLAVAQSSIHGKTCSRYPAAPRLGTKSLNISRGKDGSPSSLDIEPCASHQALISGAFWKMFASLALRHNRLA